MKHILNFTALARHLLDFGHIFDYDIKMFINNSKHIGGHKEHRNYFYKKGKYVNN